MLLTAEPSLQALVLIFNTESHCIVLAGLELTNSLTFVAPASVTQVQRL